MLNNDQLRIALDGRSLRRVAKDTGISYDALYRFMGKPLSLQAAATLSDYVERLNAAVYGAGNDSAKGSQ